MSCESLSSPHQRRRRLLDGPPPSPLLPAEGEEVETRDWAELPRDALLLVLHRLDDIADVIFGAGHVCRSWRRETREEPELWRRIDMRRLAGLFPRRSGDQLCALARSVLLHSAGRCEAFWAKGVSEDYFTELFSHGVPAPFLKSLGLISCEMSLTLGLSVCVKKFPLLEELELSVHKDTMGDLAEVCAAAAEACPLLKILRLNKERYRWHREPSVQNKEATEIAKLHGLRSLQLVNNSLGNDGLAAIIDGCPHLESLDIRRCFTILMDRDDIRRACDKIKTLRLPRDPTDDYEHPVASPEVVERSYDMDPYWEWDYR